MSSTLDSPVDADALVQNFDEADESGVIAVTRPSSRPMSRRVMHWVRRLHLYLGLFLFPWAVLYGFTGFLFNHPEVMSEAPMVAFGREAWTGTPMEQSVDLADIARQVIAGMQDRHPGKAALQLVETEPIRYVNELAFATLKTREEDIGFAIGVLGTGGTIRRTPTKKPDAAFPWATSHGEPPPGGNPMMQSGSGDKIFIENSVADRLKVSLPQLIQFQKLPTGEWTVTSVPDLTFVVESDGQRWKTNYNALKGTITGKPLETAITPLSWRRFMLRLHTAHGYPQTSLRAKWFWAILVDVMAWVMIYWGGSGLLMWWQIKSTRRLGIAMLLLSAVVATVLTIGMSGFFHAA